MGLTHADVGLAMQGMDSLQRAILQRQMMDRQKKEDAAKDALNQQLMGLRQTEAGNQNERYKQASKHEDRMYQAELDRNSVSQSRLDSTSKAEQAKAEEIKRRLAVTQVEALRKETAAMLKDKTITPDAANRIVRSLYTNMNPMLKEGLAGTPYENDPGDIFTAQKGTVKDVTKTTDTAGNSHEVTREIPEEDYKAPPKAPEEGSIEAERAAAEKALVAAQVSGDPKALKMATEKLARIQAIDKKAVFNPITGKMEIPGMDAAAPGAKSAPAPLPSQSENIDLGNGQSYKTTAVPSWKEHPEAIGIQAQIADLDAKLKAIPSEAPESTEQPAFGMFGAGGGRTHIPLSLQEKIAFDKQTMAQSQAAIAKKIALQKRLEELKAQYPGQQVPTVPATTPYPFE